MKNGAKSSNIENSIIYVGKVSEEGVETEQICAKVGPNLPQNQWITFTCEDQNAAVQSNVFGTDQGN